MASGGCAMCERRRGPPSPPAAADRLSFGWTQRAPAAACSSSVLACCSCPICWMTRPLRVIHSWLSGDWLHWQWHCGTRPAAIHQSQSRSFVRLSPHRRAPRPPIEPPAEPQLLDASGLRSCPGCRRSSSIGGHGKRRIRPLRRHDHMLYLDSAARERAGPVRRRAAGRLRWA